MRSHFLPRALSAWSRQLFAAPTRVRMFSAVMVASVIAASLSTLSLRAGAARAELAAPVLDNPGAQSHPVTNEYGYAAAVLRHSPISYWRLDDATGTTVADWSATPHAGTITGTIARLQSSALADGSASMTFPGVAGTRIDLADDAAFRLTDAVTVEAWVKVANGDAAGSIFEKSVSGALSYRLAQESGAFNWKINGTFGELSRWVTIAPADVGSWTHLVGTFDGIRTKLYKNGVLVHSHLAEGTLATGAGVSRIGGLANDGYPLDGGLDDVAIYGAALTAGQIATHYALRTSVATVSLQLSATDSDNDPLTFSATGLPPGLYINPSTGRIWGNPTQAGTFNVTATAQDPGGQFSSQPFTWTITSTPAVNPNRPVLTNPGNQTHPVTLEYGYAAAVLMTNPVGYWRLGDRGPLVADWSRHFRTATQRGEVTPMSAGALAEPDPATRFNGDATARIDVADNSAFRLTQAVTVEAWVKTDDAAANGAVFEKTAGAPTAPAYRLMQEAGSWVWRVSGTFGWLNRGTPVAAQDVGAWVHLVGTFDGAVTRLYKNGVLVSSAPAQGTLTDGEGTTRIGLLGMDVYPFLGTIDEVAGIDKLYKRQ